MALGSGAVAEASFDVERTLHGRRARSVDEEQHVFVAGLARAGTTILMRSLHQSGLFRSLTYRDMPFVLAPNLWRAVSRQSRREAVAVERAHGDGIRVDFDSPEALEEVFWRVFCGDDYIRSDRLIPMRASDEIVTKFRTYIKIVLSESGTTRYLSKNNNNILRLKSISAAFPAAIILIPFRDPVQQAASLLRQHRRFLALHHSDSFSKQYMTWLAHHEFGADHRPFVFGERPAPPDVDDLRYWLELWISTYSYLHENAPAQAIFIDYERLCEHSDEVWAKLSDLLGLPSKCARPHLRVSRQEQLPTGPSMLIRQASELSHTLMSAAL